MVGLVFTEKTATIDAVASTGRKADPDAALPPAESHHAASRRHFPYFLLALGAAVYWVPFLRVLWRVGDEGTLVYGAQRVAEGAVPYRDFLEVMGPGAFYWLGLFFKIFGPSWLVSRAVLLFTGIATVLLVFWLARRLRAGAEIVSALLVVTLTLPIWPAASHHWDSNLFALIAFSVFLSWLDRRRSWLLLAAGALAGVVSLFMQQKGLLLLISFVAAIWLLDRKEPRWWSSAVRLVTAYAAVGAAVVLGFFAAGALPDLLHTTFWAASSYNKLNSIPYAFGLIDWCWRNWVEVLGGPGRPLSAHALATSFLGPFLLIAGLPLLLGALAMGRRDWAFQRSALPYWTAGGALWVSEIHRPDMFHLIYGSPILLVLCISLLRQQRRRFWVYGLRLLVVSTVLFGGYQALIAQSAQHRMDTRRGSVYLLGRDEALDFLHRELAPGDDLFVYPYYPMYYFLSGTRNPTRFSFLLYHYNTEAQFHEVVASLERRKVKYVLWDTWVDGPNLKRWFPAYQHPVQEELILEPYLTEHYDLTGYKNGFRVMRRKDSQSNSR